MALRGEEPGAHLFTVYDAANEEERKAVSNHRVFGLDSWEGFGIARSVVGICRITIAAPQIPSTTDYSWTESNPSTYMIDSGLWSACRESKEIAKKWLGNRWRGENRDRRTPALYFLPESDPDDPRFISVNLGRDLFLLSPINFESIGWHLIANDIFGGDLSASSPTIHHVGFEFDPAWRRWLDFLVMDLHIQSHNVHCNQLKGVLRPTHVDENVISNIWFVDYRLKRREEVLGKRGPARTWPGRSIMREPVREPKRRRQFNGDGCVFTEVREDDDVEWDLSLQSSRGVLPFVQELEKHLRHPGNLSTIYGASAPSEYIRFPRLGVLACEAA
ncbi:hypothetical protein OQA88_2215 [Cercophora sp. LCS_1]